MTASFYCEKDTYFRYKEITKETKRSLYFKSLYGKTYRYDKKERKLYNLLSYKKNYGGKVIYKVEKIVYGL